MSGKYIANDLLCVVVLYSVVMMITYMNSKIVVVHVGQLLYENCYTSYVDMLNGDGGY